MTITIPPLPPVDSEEPTTRAIATRRGPKSSHRGERRHGRIVLQHARREISSVVLLVALFFLIVLPVIFLIVAAFSTAVPRPGNPDLGEFTLDNFAILATPQGVQSLLNSIVIGAGAGLLSLIIGAVLAFIAARSDAPWRRFIFIAGMAPMFLPALVGALAWSILGSPTTGHINAIRACWAPLACLGSHTVYVRWPPRKFPSESKASMSIE